MTTITFGRSGGIIGNELHYTFELESLSEEETQRIQKLIEDANFFNIPANLEGSSSPDEFRYEITVNDGTENHTVYTTDTAMPQSLIPLVKELTMQRVLHQ